MSSFDHLPSAPGGSQDAASRGDALRSMHGRPPVRIDLAHVEALEKENVRLQLLVAELLIKNQQLRKDSA